MTDFNPNEPADIARVRGDVETHRWASYCPGQKYGKNRGAWKTHRRLREVRQAIEFAGWGEITVYERVDGEWVERYRQARREVPPVRSPGWCHVCGSPIKTDESRGRATEKWSPDEDFAKVEVHWRCEGRLAPRRGRDS